MAKKMAEFKEQALLSYQLATIETHLPLDMELSSFTIDEMDKPLLRELFSELEFKRWLSEVSDADTLKQVAKNQVAAPNTAVNGTEFTARANS